MTRTYVCRRASRISSAEDKPLIDLSEDSTSIGADNKSLQVAKSELSLFDALCTNTTTQHYGNVDLPKPLLSTSPPEDPFEVSPAVKLFAGDPQSRHGLAWSQNDAWSKSITNGYQKSSEKFDSHFEDSFKPNSQGALAQSLKRENTKTGEPLHQLTLAQEGGKDQREQKNQQAFDSSPAVSVAKKNVQGPCAHRSPSNPLFPEGFNDAPVSHHQKASSESSALRRPGKHLAQPARVSSDTAYSVAAESGKSLKVGPHSSPLSASPSSFGTNKPCASALPFSGAVQVLPKIPFPGTLHQTNSRGASVDVGSVASNAKPTEQTTDKAFDWLNDAISNLAVSRAGSQQAFTKIDYSDSYIVRMEKTERNADGGYRGSQSADRNYPPPSYDDIPREVSEADSGWSPSVRRQDFVAMSSKQPFPDSSPWYDEVPVDASPSLNFNQRYGNVEDILTPSSESHVSLENNYASSTSQYYACTSEFSDDFDDDEFDDDFDEPYSGDTREGPPPPLPPKDYQHKDYEGRISPEKPNIFPVLQDGKQLSHTHYFLIPPKERSSVTAAVKPFVTGSSHDDGSDEISSQANYQNISVATSLNTAYSPGSPEGKDVKPRSYSTHSSPSKYRGGSDQKGEERRRYSYQQGRSVSSSSSSKVSPNKHPPTSKTKSWDDTHSPRSESSYCDSVSRDSVSRDSISSFSNVSPRELVAQVRSSVLGVTDEESHAALCHCHWDVNQAVRYLKVEQLFRMGLATRQHCHSLLEALQWNLELASSVMLDEVRGKVQCESTV